jgi:hypothetical protein
MLSYSSCNFLSNHSRLDKMSIRDKEVLKIAELYGGTLYESIDETEDVLMIG